jgi:type VI secretion system protein VasI
MRADVEAGNLDHSTVLLRFDKEPAKSYNASHSTDGEAVFLPGAVGLIRTMAKHERMLFRFTPFNSPPQETTFDLRGLNAALSPLKKACGWS